MSLGNEELKWNFGLVVSEWTGALIFIGLGFDVALLHFSQCTITSRYPAVT